MLEKFEKSIVNTLKNEKVLTENGAIAYKTSGKELVDFNFKISSYRNMTDTEIRKDYAKVFYEDTLLAIKMLFFVGDIRQGMGERRTFQVCLNWLADVHANIANAILPLIKEYNRWDSMINLCFHYNTQKEAVNLIASQLLQDENDMNEGRPISLLAKWMPSINASSKTTIYKGKKLAKLLKQDYKSYRKMLSAFRKYLKVVEVNMASNHWENIDYNTVPSKANILYKEAFMRHDSTRRENYLLQLQKGEAKINSGVSFPYDIIHKYNCYKTDVTLEEMWKSLPDFIKGNGNDTICVVDGSGSMMSSVGNTNITCHDVARSLAIYFSEKMQGAFHNKFITFSRRPQLISFSDKETLRDKIIKINQYDEVANTDIEKVFNLILQSAIDNNLSNDELPKNILVLSDMEFDDYSVHIQNYHGEFNSNLKTLFELLRVKYENAGYKLPRLVFWNICSRNCGIPIKENENGVALISGFSPAIASMVFSTKLDPYEVIVEKLNSSRYDEVENAITGIIYGK